MSSVGCTFLYPTYRTALTCSGGCSGGTLRSTNYAPFTVYSRAIR